MSTPDETGGTFFLEYLASIRNAIVDKSALNISRYAFIDQTFDFLSRDCWQIGFYKALCLAANSQLPKTGSVAVVATVRNEGPYIIDWLAHYKAIGVEEFFIYTNDNSDGSLALLHVLADAGEIFLIESDVSHSENPQVKAYDHSLILNAACRSFRWLAYLDADELLLPAAKFDYRLDKMIDNLTGSLVFRPSSISFSWMWMGSDGAVRREPDRKMSERFLIGQPTSLFVKSIVDPDAVLSMRSVHKPVMLANCFGVNTAGELVDTSDHSSPFCFEGGEIRHYWNKSYEEFLVKQARGVDRAIWERETDRFFDWDVTVANGGELRPFPEKLAHLVDEYADMIRQSPDVMRIEHAVKSAHSALSRVACCDDDLESHYTKSKNRAFIRSMLIQPQSTPIDPSAEVVTALHACRERLSKIQVTPT